MNNKYFKYSADRLPILLFLSVSLLDFCLYFMVDNWLVLIPYVLLILPIKGAVSAFNHHHQHHKTFNNPILNHILEFSYFLHTGAASHMWVLQHNFGHHSHYTEPLKDEARWMTNSRQTMSSLKYTLTNSLDIYGHVIRIGKRHPKLLKFVVYHHIVGILLLAALVFYSPLNALILFVLPMFSIFIFTVFATYDHHADLDPKTPYHASRNNLNKWHNIIHGNLGYHTAHHLRPALHWSKLPAYHETIKDQIPDELMHNSYFDWRKPSINNSFNS